MNIQITYPELFHLRHQWRQYFR